MWFLPSRRLMSVKNTYGQGVGLEWIDDENAELATATNEEALYQANRSKFRMNKELREGLRDIRLWGLANYLLLYGLLSHYASAMPVEQTFLPLTLVDTFPSGYTLPMIVLLILSCYLPQLSRMRKALPATLFFLAGFSMLTVSVLGDAISFAVLLISLCCLAVGLVFSTAAWLESMTLLTPLSIALTIVVAQVISAVVQLPLLPTLPDSVRIILIFVAIALNGSLLFLWQKKEKKEKKKGTLPAPVASPQDTLEYNGSDHPVDTSVASASLAKETSGFAYLKTLVARLGAPMLCVGAVALGTAITETLASRNLEVHEWGYPELAFGRLLGIFILGIVWLIGGAHSRGDITLRRDRIMLALYGVIILEFILYPLFGLHYAPVFLVFGHASMTVAFVLALEACVEEMQSCRRSSVPSACLLYSIMYTAATLGIFIAGSSSPVEEFDLTSLLIQALAVIVTLALALIIMVVMHTQKRGVGSGGANSADDKSTSDATIISYSEESLRSNPQLTEMYQLSKREIDVVVLLAGGRTVKHISKTLFISENTVRGHMKNIYQKLGVHKKQEMLDLLAELAQQDET